MHKKAIPNIDFRYYVWICEKSDVCGRTLTSYQFLSYGPSFSSPIKAQKGTQKKFGEKSEQPLEDTPYFSLGVGFQKKVNLPQICFQFDAQRCSDLLALF